jgi:2-dehydropantoate 2-reductase
VISFQNGVSNAESCGRCCRAFEVAQGMVPFNVARLGQGRWHKGTSGDLVVRERESAALAELVSRSRRG